MNKTLIFFKIVPYTFNTLILENFLFAKALKEFLNLLFLIHLLVLRVRKSHLWDRYSVSKRRKGCTCTILCFTKNRGDKGLILKRRKAWNWAWCGEYGGCCTCTILCFTKNCWDEISVSNRRKGWKWVGCGEYEGYCTCISLCFIQNILFKTYESWYHMMFFNWPWFKFRQQPRRLNIILLYKTLSCTYVSIQILSFKIENKDLFSIIFYYTLHIFTNINIKFFCGNM